MTYQRQTLAREAVFEGFSLHSGVPVRVVVRPAEHGIVFRHGSYVIEALPQAVSETRRCTRLGDISTIEHLMSAFAGLEITDADVEVSAPELPALDGSSREYVGGLRAAGISPLGEAEIQPLFTRVFVQEEGWKVAVSSGEGHWRYCFESDKWPIEQVFETDDVLAAYADQIAPARTFGFEDEIPAIQAQGLAKGLDLDKALIVGSGGYVNEARFPDELARHKLLDTIGDLYLAGVPIRFLNVVAERSGHTANVKAAAILREAVFG